jgi:hypothetical protein
MSRKNYWTSPKGKDARFLKMERGKFAASA